MKRECKKLLCCIGIFLLFDSVLMGCGGNQSSSTDTISQDDEPVSIDSVAAINSEGNTVKTRYNVPPRFHRVDGEAGSFAEYLQNLPLKPLDYPVHLYNGQEKGEKIVEIYDGRKVKMKVNTAVIDLELDTVDNQDAVGSIIRLRGEYLYQSGQYDRLRFHLSKRFVADFVKWAKGYRLVKKGNEISWKKDGKEDDYSYENFRAYLSAVMKAADMKTLKLDMEKVSEEGFGIGTVILSDDSPQHAAIVVDMIRMTGAKGWRTLPALLLAQGGSPSQEIEIIGGNADEFGWFGNPKHNEFYKFWTTTNYGERYINKQGGLLMTGDKDYNNKHLYRFTDDTFTAKKK